MKITNNSNFKLNKCKLKGHNKKETNGNKG